MITVQAVVGRNFRDIGTGNPKVLLTKLEGFDRDHCWVDKHYLDKVIPKTQRQIKVQFTAKTKQYLGGKQTLTCIEDVRVLGKA